MWLSKRKMKEREDKAYNDGIGIGYGLGFQMGQVESQNRTLNPKSFIENQIENILKQKGVGNDN